MNQVTNVPQASRVTRLLMKRRRTFQEWVEILSYTVTEKFCPSRPRKSRK